MTETIDKKELKRIEYERKRLEYIQSLGYGSIDEIIDEARKGLDEEPDLKVRDYPQWASRWDNDAYINIDDDGKYNAFCGDGEPLVTDSLERAVDWILCLSAWKELDEFIEYEYKDKGGLLSVSVDLDDAGWPALFMDGAPTTRGKFLDRLYEKMEQLEKEWREEIGEED